MWAIIGILSALLRRQSTGRGGVVETSLSEAALFWRDSAFAQYLASGTPPRRPGNASGNVVPYGVFKTKDRPIMIGCAGDALFATLARLLDRAEWITDPRFARNSRRVANRASLEPLIEEALLSRTVDEWVELLGTNRVPCSPILGTDEAYCIRRCKRSEISSRRPISIRRSCRHHGASTACDRRYARALPRSANTTRFSIRSRPRRAGRAPANKPPTTIDTLDAGHHETERECP